MPTQYVVMQCDNLHVHNSHIWRSKTDSFRCHGLTVDMTTEEHNTYEPAYCGKPEGHDAHLWHCNTGGRFSPNYRCGGSSTDSFLPHGSGRPEGYVEGPWSEVITPESDSSVVWRNCMHPVDHARHNWHCDSPEKVKVPENYYCTGRYVHNGKRPDDYVEGLYKPNPGPLPEQACSATAEHEAHVWWSEQASGYRQCQGIQPQFTPAFETNPITVLADHVVPGIPNNFLVDDAMFNGEAGCVPEFPRNVQRVEAPADDEVNHPKHYTSHPSGIEVIEITRHMGFNLGNVVKYVMRCDLKHDAIQDLKKARWYLDDEIAKREKARNG